MSDEKEVRVRELVDALRAADCVEEDAKRLIRELRALGLSFAEIAERAEVALEMAQAEWRAL